MKKALKVIAIIVAIAAVAVAAYILIKKYVDSKRVVIGNDAENYVSCSFCDDSFVSENGGEMIFNKILELAKTL